MDHAQHVSPPLLDSSCGFNAGEVKPADKLKLVEALQAEGRIVATLVKGDLHGITTAGTLSLAGNGLRLRGAVIRLD